MQCPKCKADIPEKFKFCPECGSNISSMSKESGIEKSLGGIKTISGKSTDLSIGNINTVITPGEKTSGRLLKDRYELAEEIGNGGFAVVYRAIDRKLGNREVAVKILKLSEHTDNQTITRFKAESGIIASLNHRNIVTVFDSDIEGDEPFIVMEYINSGNLKDYLKDKGKLNLDEALNLFKGICSGAAYAHRKNLVHRDLKPGNVMLTKDGNELIPKIVDFGLARLGGSSDVSVSGYGMGTPFYMPPEQRRDAKSVNHTADIYALGKILYEMLTGEVPDNVDQKLIPKPDTISDIIFKCVKSRPEERYFSVDEILNDVNHIKAGNTHGRKPSAEQSSINTCPSCSFENKTNAKYCASCGAGLYKKCPECGDEFSISLKYCSSCGTDVDIFVQASEVLSKMEKYSSEKKWSRVIKEEALLPKDMKLTGVKGANILKKIREYSIGAEKNEKQLAEVQGQLNTLVANADYEKVRKSLDKIRELSEHKDGFEALERQIQLAELKGQLNTLIANADYGKVQKTLEKIRVLLDNKDEIEALEQQIHSQIFNNEYSVQENQISSFIEQCFFDEALTTLDFYAEHSTVKLTKKELDLLKNKKIEILRKCLDYLILNKKFSGTYEYLTQLKELGIDETSLAEIQKTIEDEECSHIIETCNDASPKGAISKYIAKHPESKNIPELEKHRARIEEKNFNDKFKTLKEEFNFHVANENVDEAKLKFDEISLLLKNNTSCKIIIDSKVIKPEDLLVSLNGPIGDMLLKKLDTAIKMSERLRSQGRYYEAKEQLDNLLKNCPELRDADNVKLTYAKIKTEKEQLPRDLKKMGRRITVFLVLVTLSVMAVIRANAYFQYKNAMKEGNDFLASKDYDKAVISFKNAQKIYGYEKDDLAINNEKSALDKRNIDIQNLERRKNKSEYDDFMAQGQKALDSKNLEDAENVFKKALTIPGYTEDSLAIFALQKIEKLKNDIEYGKAMDEGKKAISGEKWSEAEVAFKKALSLKGYESDLSALEGLKSAEKELELKKNRDAAKAAFEDASKKVITLLISIQNESKPTTERLNACDEALSLLDSTDKFCKIYLSSGDQSEISSLKSQIATLKSKLCPVLGNDWAIPDIGMEFVWIKALDCWVGKYEVTNGEYRKYKADHDSKDYFNGNRQPVVYVNYDNATEYAKWLTERERKAIPAGYIYRLPTEKEWTTFCQCGDNREYPWGNEWPPKYGNYGSMVGYYDDFFETCPVENSGKNDWGLYGVGGNVWECTIKSSSDLSFDAWRGASWCNDYPGDLRSAYHGVYSALDRGNVIGFRLVLSR